MATARRPYITVGTMTLPPINVVCPVTLTVGRDDPTAQPDANALSFGWIGNTMPDAIHRGAPIRVWFAADEGAVDEWDDVWEDVWEGSAPSEGSGNKRFVGTVTDITVQPAPVANLVMATVNCIGSLSAFGEQIIGDEPWPIETDKERAERLAALVRGGLPFVPDGNPALRLRRRDADRRRLLELLHLSGSSVGSIVWEWPDGSIHYQRFDARDVPLPGESLHLPAQAIIAESEWAQSSDQLIDRVRVEYGDDPETGNRPEYIAGDGLHEVRHSTDVADLPTAEVVGSVILARWGRTDVWDAPAIMTSAALLEEGTYEELLAILPGETITTGGLTQEPSPGTAGGGVWFVEGWEEVWDRAGPGAPLEHDFTISVSDIRRFAVSGAEVAIQLAGSHPMWTMSSSGVTTYTVSGVGGAMLPARGILSLLINNSEAALSFDLGSEPQKAAHTFSVPQDSIPPGGTYPHVVRALYSGYPGQYRPGASNSMSAQVNPSATHVISLDTPARRPHTGDSVLLNARLFGNTTVIDEETGLPAIPEGTVRFEYAEAVGGPWTLHEILDASGGEEGVTVTSVWIADLGDVWWRARFVAATGDTRWGSSDRISREIALEPVAPSPQTIEYQPSWVAQYAEDGTLQPGTDLRQGDWGDGLGDQRGFIGYNVDWALWQNFQITKVEVLMTASFQNGQGGTVRIGSHQFELPTDVDHDQLLHRTDVSQWPEGTTRWVDITSWGKGFVKQDGPQGLVIGPADAVSPLMQAVIYGSAPPVLRISGYQWASGEGAWDSVPSTLTWDTVDPEATWDTFL